MNSAGFVFCAVLHCAAVLAAFFLGGSMFGSLFRWLGLRTFNALREEGINAVDGNGCTPLILAVLATGKGHMTERELKDLIASGAKVNAVSQTYGSVLRCAVDHAPSVAFFAGLRAVATATVLPQEREIRFFALEQMEKAG